MSTISGCLPIESSSGADISEIVAEQRKTRIAWECVAVPRAGVFVPTRGIGELATLQVQAESKTF